jgi:hypothetical protein
MQTFLPYGHGHQEALAAYGVAICREWIRRGHADTVLGMILAYVWPDP